MPRYVALLRGVSPMNLKMPELKRALELAGFGKVKTLLSSGNAAFDSSSRTAGAVERQVEAALSKQLGRTFHTIVRSRDELEEMIETNPFARFELPPDAKPVVTFARKLPAPKQKLPIEKDGARILASDDRHVFSAYVPNGLGPVFMQLIERNFGSDLTTRTWETVKKCAKA
ncbi:hypothetical protein DB347_22450 [Opitutaceae bacterium EW11]|nr:hypothetical protein DB347_22450 [Opitutaceae bacterium EW11]